MPGGEEESSEDADCCGPLAPHPGPRDLKGDLEEVVVREVICVP